MRILIVDDEYAVAEAVKDDLEALGHTVQAIAQNCPAALEALWADRPDVALVDTELAGETCEAVLEECAALGVPVVICSAHAADDLPDFCEGLVALSKPFMHSQLQDALSRSTATLH